MLERLKDASSRTRIRDETIRLIREERGGGDPANVQISSCEWDPSLAGKRLSEVTSARKLAPTVENAADTVLWMIEQGECLAIFHAIDEQDLQRILKHPSTMIASDGGIPVYGQASPHPRSYGTFVRVLGHYVRELKVITLEDAVRKMSGFPAKRLGLADRGLLKEGLKADLVSLRCRHRARHGHLLATSSVRRRRVARGHQRRNRVREWTDDRRAPGPCSLRPGARAAQLVLRSVVVEVTRDDQLAHARRIATCSRTVDQLSPTA